MDKLSDDMIGLYEQRAILDAMAWRHHNFDVNDPVSEDGFSASDVQTLTERVVDLRLVPSGLLFRGGLATTWDFLGFRPIFKDTEGNGSRWRTLFVATQERKARSAAKKKERKRQGGDGGEGSRPAIKKKKIVARKDGPVISEATSSQEPLQSINPIDPSETVAETAESREDHSPRVSPHGSSNRSAHNYSDTHVNEETSTLRLGTSIDQSRRAMTNVNTEVVQPSLMHRPAHHSPTATRSASLSRSIQQGESSSRGSLYVPIGPSTRDAAWIPLCGVESLWSTWPVNKDQALRIKELLDELARKDSAIVYAKRLNAERAQEREKLVAQLSITEMEKFNCVRKLLPTVVKRLLQSHKMENFEVYADKKMRVEYDKLFENRYPYVEKISRSFRHPIFDLLKVYPDSPSSGQAPPSQPSSEKAASTFAPRAS
nr:hypothetical protein [Tanacetum cinerariifolium]